jgi:hypothetical protein
MTVASRPAVDMTSGYRTSSDAMRRSNPREGEAMIRKIKLVTLALLGAGLLTSTACEDKVCQDALQACKQQGTDQRKEGAAHLATISELKSQLAAAQAKADGLTKENDELKAKSEEAAAKGKAKGGKAKHKKKGKK